MSNRSLLMASVLVSIAAIVLVTSVSAHSRRKSSTPEAGEILAVSPASVEIEFTQEIQKISGTYGIEVVNSSGASVTVQDAVIDEADRTLMSVALQPELPPGRYVVTYNNVSDADGDEFRASFSFYVGVEPSEEDLAADRELAEAEGGEATPTPGTTPGPNETSQSGATATPTNGQADGNGGGGDSAILVIVAVAAAAVGIGLGFGAYRYLRSRS